ncbi:hypothetical protein PR048_004585 [Dryococelus australis]|uniref:Uncharacterized protein n=1 Tax=Dryococelus australis TaxID=614101 RepID=A0ABQ9I5U8_9NEOP|nr:hypothetical protein PR048_004585 [Dryococelus australis]
MERVDAHVSVAPSAPTLLGLRILTGETPEDDFCLNSTACTVDTTSPGTQTVVAITAEITTDRHLHSTAQAGEFKQPNPVRKDAIHNKSLTYCRSDSFLAVIRCIPHDPLKFHQRKASEVQLACYRSQNMASDVLTENPPGSNSRKQHFVTPFLMSDTPRLGSAWLLLCAMSLRATSRAPRPTPDTLMVIPGDYDPEISTVTSTHLVEALEEGPRWLSSSPARLPPRRSGLNSRPGHSGLSHVGIVVGEFSGGSPVYLALSFRPCSILSSITLIGSQDLDMQLPRDASSSILVQCPSLGKHILCGLRHKLERSWWMNTLEFSFRVQSC